MTGSPRLKMNTMAAAMVLALLPAFASAAIRIPILPIDVVFDQTDQMDGVSGEGIVDGLAMDMAAADSRRVFDFRKAADPSGGMGKTTMLDAKGYAQRESLDYCLFGYCVVGIDTAEIVLSLYERVSDRVVKSYYAKDSKGSMDSIIREMADKVVASMYASLEVEPLASRHPARISVCGGGGWWYPVAWDDAMISCCYADLAIRFLGAAPSPAAGRLMAAFGFGLGARYQLAVSQPAVEPFSCHFARICLPLDLRLSSRADIGFSLSIKPFYDFSFAFVQRRYGAEETVNGGVPGCGFSASLDLYLGKRQNCRVGLLIGCDALAYDQFAIQPSVGLEFDLLMKEL